MRYLRLYSYFCRFALSRAMAFWADSALRIIMDVIYYIVAIAFFKVLYLHTNSLAGFSEADAFVFVGCYTVIDGIFMTIFSGNVWELGRLINNGRLDYSITKPASPFFFACFQKIEVGSLLNTFMAIGILVWALVVHPATFSSINLLLAIISLPFAVWLYFLIALAFALPAFWTQSANGLTRVFYSIEPMLERPDGVYRGRGSWIFFTILPFAILASYPARFFVGKWSELQLFHFYAVVLAMSSVVMLLWAAALRRYSSASS